MRRIDPKKTNTIWLISLLAKYHTIPIFANNDFDMR